MELYLNINRPGGKKFNFVDRGKIRRRRDGSAPEVHLYPDKPTEVADVDAEHLLRQDPHLVSKTKPTFEPGEPRTADEWRERIAQLEKEKAQLQAKSVPQSEPEPYKAQGKARKS